MYYPHYSYAYSLPAFDLSICSPYPPILSRMSSIIMPFKECFDFASFMVPAGNSWRAQLMHENHCVKGLYKRGYRLGKPTWDGAAHWGWNSRSAFLVLRAMGKGQGAEPGASSCIEKTADGSFDLMGQEAVKQNLRLHFIPTFLSFTSAVH